MEIEIRSHPKICELNTRASMTFNFNSTATMYILKLSNDCPSSGAYWSIAEANETAFTSYICLFLMRKILIFNLETMREILQEITNKGLYTIVHMYREHLPSIIYNRLRVFQNTCSSIAILFVVDPYIYTIWPKHLCHTLLCVCSGNK